MEFTPISKNAYDIGKYTYQPERSTWQTTYSAVVPVLDKHAVWDAWAAVDRWHLRNTDIDAAELHGAFVAGARFTLRPNGGPRVTISLIRAEPLAG